MIPFNELSAQAQYGIWIGGILCIVILMKVLNTLNNKTGKSFKESARKQGLRLIENPIIKVEKKESSSDTLKRYDADLSGFPFIKSRGEDSTYFISMMKGDEYSIIQSKNGINGLRNNMFFGRIQAPDMYIDPTNLLTNILRTIQTTESEQYQENTEKYQITTMQKEPISDKLKLFLEQNTGWNIYVVNNRILAYKYRTTTFKKPLDPKKLFLSGKEIVKIIEEKNSY